MFLLSEQLTSALLHPWSFFTPRFPDCLHYKPTHMSIFKYDVTTFGICDTWDLLYIFKCLRSLGFTISYSSQTIYHKFYFLPGVLIQEKCITGSIVGILWHQYPHIAEYLLQKNDSIKNIQKKSEKGEFYALFKNLQVKKHFACYICHLGTECKFDKVAEHSTPACGKNSELVKWKFSIISYLRATRVCDAMNINENVATLPGRDH